MPSSNVDFKYYRYHPSLAGAIIFAVIFGVSTAYHSIQIAKFRTWYFIPLLVGGVCTYASLQVNFRFTRLVATLSADTFVFLVEIIGYGTRGVSIEQTPNWTLGPYIIQSILLLVAPALFAASIYMILGRIIISIDGESYSLIKKRWLTKVFVTGDVLSFVIQSGGTYSNFWNPDFLGVVIPYFAYLGVLSNVLCNRKRSRA